MSYLQITTKCNMTCEHCGFSCGKRGKHGTYEQILENIEFIEYEYADEMITIGGGEPTIHPRFFDILQICLRKFDQVWMATNGSQTLTMYRLNDIMQGYDFDYIEFDEYGEPLTEPISLSHNNQLGVTLSLDNFHSPINEGVIKLWKQNKYDIRDVSRNVLHNGRAARSGAAQKYGCVCPSNIIRPDGSIKMCGCERSPIIGTVKKGIDKKWRNYMLKPKYENSFCYFGR